ncbi:carbohydrate binding domain-containing protein [Chitinispirillales bacterium ANBcel5]|uniref:hypothetical protein n=1 Tax=Cellulosispirillum alkaliphilum TaxID=3039283 RepID=UPI002A51A542|nr:carbohydrate binding domain-containing protein [Chitinispirillales bacterium ANBcel5]
MNRFSFNCIFLIFVAILFSSTHAVILSDFEDGTTTNNFKGEWTAYADREDGGNSEIINGTLREEEANTWIIDPTLGEGNPTGTPLYGMKMQYSFGTMLPGRGTSSWGATVGIATSLSDAKNGARDLTGATQITFWAKASSRLNVRVQVPTSGVNDYGYHRRIVTIDTVWEQHSVNISQLVQPTWARRVSFNLERALRLQWEISADDLNPSEATFWLDDIEIVGFDANAPETELLGSTITERKPIFNWSHVTGAQTYTIQIATSNTFSAASIIHQDTLFTNSFTPDSDLPITTIFWRVKADNSPWSIMEQVAVLDVSIPVLIPQQSPTFDRRPVFSWHRPPVEDPSFTIEISQNSSFSPVQIRSTRSDTFYTPQADLPIGVFHWRVNTDGGTWSEVNSFLVEDDRIPLLIPYESPTFNRSPVLTWYKPSRAISNYTIELSQSRSFSDDPIVESVSDTFYLSSNLPVGKIFWRVSADDSEFSDIDSFEVKDARVPILLAHEPRLCNNKTPTFHWHPVEGASSYVIQVGSSNTGSLATPHVSAQIADTFFTVDVPLTPGLIMWRVRSDLVDTFSLVDTYTLQADSIPYIIRFDGEIINDTRPVLKWHPVPEETIYHVVLSQQSGIIDPLRYPVSDTTFTPLHDLDYGTWYWTVSTDKNRGLWSLPVDSFVVEPPVAINKEMKKSPEMISVSARKNNFSLLYNSPLQSGRLSVFDIRGRLLHTQTISPGTKEVYWNYRDRSGRALSNGVFIIRVETGELVNLYTVKLKK